MERCGKPHGFPRKIIYQWWLSHRVTGRAHLHCISCPEEKPMLEEHVQKNMLNPIPKIKLPWFLRFVKTKQVVKKCKN